jgi:hypothetical protein
LNGLKKNVARLSGLALVTTGLVLGQLAYAPGANAAELVRDGGFEEAVDHGVLVLDSPDWTEADSLFDSPLCNEDICGDGDGSAGPHSGDQWAWFGGSATAGHNGSLTQDVTIPAGTASLTYWFRNGAVTAPFDATLTVKVDGTTVKTHTEAATAEPAYTQQTIDISTFADGASHTLSFNYLNGGTGTNNMTVDDVSIDASGAATTAMPAVTGVTPAGPSSSTTPKVTGTAEAGSTVRLYPNSTCSGPSIGSGSAADFAGAGITATVPTGATTTIFARALKTGQASSACSTSSVTYVNDSTKPETTITSSPPGGVAKSLTISVGFTSSEAASTFACVLDAGASAACTSPRSITVTPGQHTFKVAATDTAGNTDATPATITFTAYDCPTLNAAVAAAQAKVTAAHKKVDKAKKALKKAKKSHDATKIRKAKKNLKKAKGELKTAQVALTTAQTGASACGGTSQSPLKSQTRK